MCPRICLTHIVFLHDKEKVYGKSFILKDLGNGYLLGLNLSASQIAEE